MGIFNEFNKKEKPFFTGIARGFGFGSGGGGVAAAAVDTSVSGGTKVENVPDSPGIQWNYFTFPNSSNLTVSDGPVTVDILVVGGGGGGGYDYSSGGSGGGGGGGVVFREGIELATGTYDVSVGQGDDASVPDYSQPGTGGDGGTGGASSFNMPNSAPFSPFPAGYVALGGGGGASAMPGNANTVGTPGGSGGGGGSNTGAGGNTHYRSPNPQGIPTVSLDYGHGGVGQQSGPSTAAANGRGGGGGGAGGDTRFTPNQNRNGGGIGYKVNNFFLPTAVPSAFKNALGGNQPAPLGGGIGDTDQEFLYFGGGGGASDNVPGTNQKMHGAGGMGGGGCGGSNSATYNESDIPGCSQASQFKYYEIQRTSVATSMPGPWPGSTVDGTAPGLDGRGGGGAGNGMDDPVNQDCKGGDGGDGIVIIRSRINNKTLSATGGDSNYTYNGRKIHKYTTTGSTTFVVNSGSGTVEYFVVAGGGSGGADTEGDGGGGGAGGVRSGLLAVSPGPYTVTVGAGGARQPGPEAVGNSGSNSVFSTITAHGGGGGGGANTGSPPSAIGANGGCGGGGSGEDPNARGRGYNPLTPSPIIGGIPAPHPYTIREGCPGGGGDTSSGNRTGGGGGGAGSPGGNGRPDDGGIGGVGVQAPNTFWDPSNPLGTSGPSDYNFYFAGGGGGGSQSGNSSPGPVAGGGGGGVNSGTGDDATANTGGGGGGGNTGGAGGSGIVLIAYYPS